MIRHPEDIRTFLDETYTIEGEFGVTDDDVAFVQSFLDKDLNQENVLELHAKLTRDLGDWGGKYRDHMVTVGKYVPPAVHMVPHLMANLFMDLDKLDSWEAHNRLEAIHPFPDFNGRIGRLMWLHKALQEDYKFQRPFLHHYYYQTLRHYQ